ncbi:hypothetical protein CYMTET_45282, partial [Cymbomonas tetramitiformis]
MQRFQRALNVLRRGNVCNGVELAALREGPLFNGGLRHGVISSLLIASPYVSSGRKFTAEAAELEPRDSMDYDVAVIGAGPAGLASAIRIKQMCEEQGRDISVCVLEKGAEVGAHILSGNVFETRALDELFPDWKEQGAPLHTPVVKDSFMFLTEKMALPLPNPPQMHNDGNYIISLSQLTRWLGERAEDLGVEVYPGFAASEVLYGEDGANARTTIFAEGCRGSLSETVMKKFNLREGVDPQTYALGIKEVWQVQARVKPAPRDDTPPHDEAQPLWTPVATSGGSSHSHPTRNLLHIPRHIDF